MTEMEHPVNETAREKRGDLVVRFKKPYVFEGERYDEERMNEVRRLMKTNKAAKIICVNRPDPFARRGPAELRRSPFRRSDCFRDYWRDP